MLLDAEGRPVPTAGEAARERNPDARLHPWLAPADIVALGYPPERGLSASALSMRRLTHFTPGPCRAVALASAARPGEPRR